jgi:hypothetical protein
MSPREKSDVTTDRRLQVLDVHIVDVLAHLEALLRHSHSIQRALLQLRGEAPPPGRGPAEDVLAALHNHARDMRRECAMLGEIIDDLSGGIETLDTVATKDQDR